MSFSYSANGIMDQAIASTEDLKKRLNDVVKLVQDHDDVAEALKKNVESIGNFVSVIEKISSQTKMLAINAAVEAARAGEHGKGFAVVAEEVQELSNRVSETTKSISTEISSIKTDTIRAENLMASLTEQIPEIENSSKKLADTTTETKTQSILLQQAAYRSMSAGHIICILVRLKEIHLNLLSAVLDFPNSRFPVVDNNKNYFADWYYHSDDNEFNFRTLPEFKSLGNHYNRLFVCIDQMKT